MKFKKVAVLTSQHSWFVPYAQQFVRQLLRTGFGARLFHHHQKISARYEVVFILSYFQIVPKEYLLRHCHNIVVHESALPRGAGWAPLSWQILEGKNVIPAVLFDAGERADTGVIFMRSFLRLKGDELYAEIRRAQARLTINMCRRFLKDHGKLRPQTQTGLRTFYRKRTPEDSELDIRKSIKSQFNLLRVVDNENFPAFFCHKGKKYLLRIEKEGAHGRKKK